MTARAKALWIAVGTAGLLAAASALDPRGFRRHLRLQEDIAQLVERNRDLSERNRRMGESIEALNRDPSATERAIREELGYVRPGEVVFHLE